MSKIWLNSTGQIIKNDDEQIIVCEDCPCGGDCSAFATSYIVTSPGFINATTVNLIPPPPIPCSMDANGPCVWMGIVSGGILAGQRVFISKNVALGWSVDAVNASCGSTYSGAQIVETFDPPGAYFNSITVT